MKKFLAVLAIAGAFTFSLTGEAVAQTATPDSATTTVSGDIGATLYLSAATDASFPTPTAADFDSTYVEVSAGNLVYKANVTHTVTVAASTANMLDATGTATTKPSSDVSYSFDGGAFTALTTTGASVASSAAAGETTKAVKYRMDLDWAKDAPKTYKVDVVYSITQG